ncbi:hypothetical protein WMF11_07755 [Sorangium sp. So ce295]|uniref:hypothetical protein n=1 Tax=Sorangium sp. So ce295 TaxID=3133295 RepID=UPI003F5E7370
MQPAAALEQSLDLAGRAACRGEREAFVDRDEPLVALEHLCRLAREAKTQLVTPRRTGVERASEAAQEDRSGEERGEPYG